MILATGNGNSIANAIIDPDAEEISTAPSSVTAQQEEKFYSLSAMQHRIELQKLELGYLGKFFGSGSKAGTNIAGITAVVALVLFVLTFFLKVDDVGAVRSGMLSIVTSALGYIFGAASKKD